MATDQSIDQILADLENDLPAEIFENPDGSVDVDFEIEEEVDAGADETEFYDNLVHYVDLTYLSQLADDVLDGMDEDEQSRAGHISDLRDGIKNLGLNSDNVEVPFEGACTVYHPLIMENAVKIQAKAEGELLPAKGPVRTEILGQVTDNKQKRASRVQKHMNWQTRDQMGEFYPNSQKALLQAALFGDSFRKNYFDTVKGRVADVLIPIDRLIVNSCYDSLVNAERITEVQYISEREMKARQYSGQYTDEANLGEPCRIDKTDLGQDIDRLLGMEGTGEGYVIVEQHLYLDLPGFEDESGVPLPYIVTVERESREVLSIRRNWAPDGNKFEKREWFTQYPFVPGFGLYNLGYIHLLGNFQNTLTAIMRSLVDAGSFANMQGGFKSKALRVLDDGSAISPGEFRDVEYYGKNLGDAIYPFQFKEPSATLMAMLQFIDGKGQKYADSAEQVVSDAANYGPVGTTMALLDASAKFFATCFKRFHAAQKHQFKIIRQLNWENLPDDDSAISINIPGEELVISRVDYQYDVDIVPVSDPNIPTAAHRLTLASQKLQSALQSPQLHNLHEVYKQYYIALGDEMYERYLPNPEEAQRLEPMEDIMAAMQGKPIKAFPDQDHEAHIAVKNAFLNDPSVAQNQAFATVAPAIQANIREHTVLRFAEQFQGAGQLGLNATQAAQAITEFNQFKAQNPLGTLDPKQLLAQAEMFAQQNESRRLDLVEEKQEMDGIVDVAQINRDIRAQNIEIMQFQQQLESDEENAEVDRALDLLKEKIKSRSSDQRNLTYKE